MQSLLASSKPSSTKAQPKTAQLLFQSQAATASGQAAASRPSGASAAAAVAASPTPARAAGFNALLEPWLFKRLLVVLTLQALQQFSGINAVVYYTPQVRAIDRIRSEISSSLLVVLTLQALATT
jgi:hypothetical protein